MVLTTSNRAAERRHLLAQSRSGLDCFRLTARFDTNDGNTQSSCPVVAATRGESHPTRTGERLGRTVIVMGRVAMKSSVPREKVRQYSDEGFFVLEAVIPHEHLELLRTVCAAAVDEMNADMDRQGCDVLGINHRGKRYFCGQTMRRHPERRELLFSDLAADICRATLGPDVYLHNDQYVVKCGREGMAFGWHQDGAYVHHRIGDHPECVTLWCALDDVNEENGTIYVLPTHRCGGRQLVEHVKDERSNDRIGYFGDDPGVPVIAPAGSIAVFSSVTFHRSGPNPGGSVRRAYLAQYAPVQLLNEPGVFPQYYGELFLQDGRS